MAVNEMRLRFILDALDRVSGPMKDIMGGSSRAAKALKETRTELQALEAQQKLVGGYQRQQAGLAEQTAKLNEAKQKQEALAAQIAATAAPTKKLQNEYAKMGREVARLEKYTTGQAESLDHLAKELKSAGIDTAKLSHHEQDLAARIKLTSSRLAEQEAKFERAAAARQLYEKRSQAAQKLAVGGAATMATGVVALAPVIATTNAARNYESVMTDIAQKSDLSRAAASKLGTQLLKISKDTNQYSEEIQRGMDTLTGKGLSTDISRGMIAPIARAATAYKAEMADLSAAGYAVYDNLKVPITEVATALDIMAAGGKAGSFELKDMARYFPALTAGYTALGQKGVGAVADLTAALEIATKGAGNADEAANNVVNLINKLNSREVAANFKKFGVDLPKALKKAYAEGKTPIEAIAELTQKALGGSMDKLSYIFGDAQVQAALRPILQNMDEYRKIRGDALKASGTVEKDFAERMRDGAEKAKANEIAIKNLAISVGGLLLPTITALIEKATRATDKIAAWAERHPQLAKAIAITATAAGALLVTLGAIGIVSGAVGSGWAALAFGLSKLSPLFGLTFGGLKKLALGIRLVSAAVIANPILASIAVIAGAAYLIYRNWDSIGPWLSKLWAGITKTFADGAAFIGQIPARMASVGTAIVQGIGQGIEGAKSWLLAKLTSLANIIPAPVRAALGIHSPSRVFADIGGHIMGGLDKGLNDNTSGPLDRLKQLSQRMATTLAVGTSLTAPAMAAVSGLALAMPPAQTPAFGEDFRRHNADLTSPKATASNTYNITLKVSSNAGVEDIKRAVAEAIAEIERKRNGRAFKDD